MDSDFGKDHIKLLIHAIEGVNRTLELKSLLSKSMESAKTLMKSEASTLMLVDGMTGELSVSIPTGPVGDEIKGLSIPKGKGISSWVAENQQPFLSNEPEETHIFWKELSPDFKTRNILCVPLLTRTQETLGVLQVLNKKEDEGYTKEDQQLFEVFASFVSAGIEKVREVDELRKKIEIRDERIRKVHEDLRENLIAINSLLQIEAEKSGESETRNILRSASARVLTIANAHFLLRNEDSVGKIEIQAFINELFASASAVFSSQKNIKVDIDLPEIHLQAEKAVTLGLIINEILVLLFRFGYQGDEVGKIHIQGRKEDNNLTIEIADDGDGIQLDKAEEESNIDLSAILRNLANSLEAEIHMERNTTSGSMFAIRCIIEKE
ncbi:MAG: GAF domain-containing protein [Balneolaceae bacterium]|nr:GAF domain-containing protein [Balneolaceae bacterium]